MESGGGARHRGGRLTARRTRRPKPRPSSRSAPRTGNADRAPNGRRGDVSGLEGEFMIVEVKGAVEDFRADRTEYLDFCGRFHFAAPLGFALEIAPPRPDGCGRRGDVAQILPEKPELVPQPPVRAPVKRAARKVGVKGRIGGGRLRALSQDGATAFGPAARRPAARRGNAAERQKSRSADASDWIRRGMRLESPNA